MKTFFTKSLYIVAIFSASSLGAFAQKEKANVGIGTTQPDESAVLDIKSSTKGLLIPRMSLQQRGQIQNPANGLMVYQTDMLSGFYFYDGKEWKPLTSETSANSVAADPNDWALAGNAVSGPGVAAATAASFIGTPTNIPINFKIGTTVAGRIGTLQTLIGNNVGAGITGGNNTAFGVSALNQTTTSTFNTAIGSNSLVGSNTGGVNTAVGSNTLNANTTGSQNAALGVNALRKNTTGSNNLAIGTYALQENLNGAGNLSVGTSSLGNLKTGMNNVAIGTLALGDAGFTEVALGAALANRNAAIGFNSSRKLRVGNDNLSMGSNALFNLVTGNNNVAIGASALLNAANSSGNVAIGFAAGQLETGSNKLYIANSSTANPLIKGEFDNKNLKVNTGATVSSTVGFLAVGNFDAAYTMPASNSYRLIVQDGIITEKVKVALKSTADWADYVFEPSYKLMSLEKVEEFVKENKHLPNVPSAEDMSKNGLDVSQTSAKLMEKIEELTLYMIEMNKEIKALKAENEKLKNK